MKGDFTRFTFDENNHFTRVLMQQGRVLLDADWNEQAAILLNFMQNLARDVFGPYGKMQKIDEDTGEDIEFKISASSDNKSFLIQAGHYYVEGIRCENDENIDYTAQPSFPLKSDDEIKDGAFLVYLDVWERHVTSVEHPHARELALGGPDTCSRAKLMYQVKIESEAPDINETPLDGTWSEITEENKSFVHAYWHRTVPLLESEDRGLLRARAVKGKSNTAGPCDIPPESKYRGPENQLYRVEIHKVSETGVASFKWSRDNGSIVFPIRKMGGATVTLYDLGVDESKSLQAGQWVELIDDDMAKRGESGELLPIEDIDPIEKTVTLIIPATADLPIVADQDDIDDVESKHPLLRRWDAAPKSSAELFIQDFVSDTDWFDLEDGIQIQFQPNSSGIAHSYRTGDYWLIPARTTTGDILWPKEIEDGKYKRDANGNTLPETLPPHGVEHFYAPLAIITVTSGTVGEPVDCRKLFKLVEA